MTRDPVHRVLDVLAVVVIVTVWYWCISLAVQVAEQLTLLG